jgi:hypothetical protein
MENEENWIIINAGWNDGIAIPFSDFTAIAGKIVAVSEVDSKLTVKNDVKLKLVSSEAINAARVAARITTSE